MKNNLGSLACAVRGSCGFYLECRERLLLILPQHIPLILPSKWVRVSATAAMALPVESSLHEKDSGGIWIICHQISTETELQQMFVGASCSSTFSPSSGHQIREHVWVNYGESSSVKIRRQSTMNVFFNCSCWSAIYCPPNNFLHRL